MGGWGWVVGIGGCIAGCAHPREKSATNFRNASIHLLPFWRCILRSDLLLSRVLRTSPLRSSKKFTRLYHEFARSGGSTRSAFGSARYLRPVCPRSAPFLPMRASSDGHARL